MSKKSNDLPKNKIVDVMVTKSGKVKRFVLNDALEAPELVKREPQKAKPGRFRKAGHLTDEMLKYTYPRDASPQLLLFDSLEYSTQEELERHNVQRETVVEGIKLTATEHKIIDSLCKLNHERSQNTDPSRGDYYAGNKEAEIMVYSGKRDIAPTLAFTLYDLTKEYKGGGRVGGDEMENVREILQGLSQKRFLLKYTETKYEKDGSRTERKIEVFRPLIEILQISETKYSKDNIEESHKEDVVITLSPIFRRQIDSKFISYPADITQRTMIAYGNPKVSEITLKLREYLMREHTQKRYTPEIGLDRLYYLLHEKWMRASRKKEVEKGTTKALEAMINLRLLERYEVTKNKAGEPKIVFHLNKEWE